MPGVKGRGDGGAASAFAQVFNLLGRYQPYGVYVPRSVTRGPVRPADGVARQQPGHRRPDQPARHAAAVRREPRPAAGHARGTRPERLRLRRQRARPARRHGRRGKTFPVDGDRVFSSGYSQGGYITFRMAFLYPAPVRRLHRLGAVHRRRHQRHARTGNRRRRHGRSRRQHGRLRRQRPARTRVDDLRRCGRAGAGHQRRGDARGVRGGRRALPLVDAHGRRAPHVRRSSTNGARRRRTRPGQRRVHDPARVTFRTATFLDAPQFGIRHDAAYWISGIRPRADAVRRHRPHVVRLRHPGRDRHRTQGVPGTEPVPYVAGRAGRRHRRAAPRWPGSRARWPT